MIDSLKSGSLSESTPSISKITALTKNLLREWKINLLAIISRSLNLTGRLGLAEKLYDGLKSIPGIKIIGQPFENGQRSPTISFTQEGKTALEVCRHLAANNICAWDGHFYAIRASEVLGLLEKGGVTRMGISIYNTEEEIDKVLDSVGKLKSV